MICKRLEIYEKTYFRLRLKTMDFLLPLIPTKFTYSVSVEIFMDITNEINETYVGRNRITFGLGNHVSEDLLIELDNILQKSRKELTTQVKKSKSTLWIDLELILWSIKLF